MAEYHADDHGLCHPYWSSSTEAFPISSLSH